jgi:hypothetical protein
MVGLLETVGTRVLLIKIANKLENSEYKIAHRHIYTPEAVPLFTRKNQNRGRPSRFPGFSDQLSVFGFRGRPPFLGLSFRPVIFSSLSMNASNPQGRLHWLLARINLISAERSSAASHSDQPARKSAAKGNGASKESSRAQQ